MSKCALHAERLKLLVTPAKAGAQRTFQLGWIPACAGMTTSSACNVREFNHSVLIDAFARLVTANISEGN
jgi:hypothetical protein